MRAWVLGALLATVSMACSGEGATATSELSSCEPLSAETRAIELGAVIGVGQAVDGTVYVIDREGTELRAFVSQDGELYRQRVAGTGEVANASGETTMIMLDELTLEVVVAPDGTTRMGVVQGVPKTKTFVIGEEGEELTLLEESDVAALPLHDYPGEILVEYVAEVEGERLLVVLRPRDFTDYDDFRVFFGTPQRLEECPVRRVGRALDGGSTRIDFSVNGDEAEAYFPVELVDDMFTRGAPTLTLGQAALEIALSDSSSLAAASYFCRTSQD